MVFVEGGKPENPEKNPRSKDENQQQTQPTYDPSLNMKCLVVFLMMLGLAMSFPRPTVVRRGPVKIPERDPQERDPVEDPYPMRDPQERDPVEDPDPMRDPQERDPVEMPPASPYYKRDPQERDPVELEGQMTGKDKRGYGYGGYRGGYGYGYGGHRSGYYGK
ncbi:hypothetical protein ACROYT_G035680 [Oculina patagonica]